MDLQKNKEHILLQTAFWKHLTAKEQSIVLQRSHIKSFSKGQLINSSDTSCMGIVFVLTGNIRISIISDEGREITLFRLDAGECCVTTASCVISQITFDTVVTATRRTTLLVIPSPVCAQLKEVNIYMRAFMYETETERFSQVIWVIQQLLFKRFDQRLADYFISIYEKTESVDLKMTQEEIARDVNSAREVVARMLKHFEEDGLVEVKRGHIILKNIEGLSQLR